MTDTLRLGVSACLLGQPVRFNGGHKRDGFLVDRLGRWVDWVPVCPEDEAGFGTPRPPMQLVSAAGVICLRTVEGGRDLTQPMRAYSAERVERLAALALDGYVFKAGSPSCGVRHVTIHTSPGVATATGRGLFAERLCARLPLLPVEDEGRLGRPRWRENFIGRVYAYRRLRALIQEQTSAQDLASFHEAHQLLLLAHSPRRCATLGAVVAAAGAGGPTAVVESIERYATIFMTALGVVATPARHADALEQAVQHLRPVLDEVSRLRIDGDIADYRRGAVPLAVPRASIAELAAAHAVGYLVRQIYLQPGPAALVLADTR